MDIKVIGTWSAKIEKNRKNTSFLIDDHILLDCGPHTAESIIDNGIKLEKIDLVLITHMHLDHFSGLPDLLWQRALRNIDGDITIMGPRNIEKSVFTLLDIFNSPDDFKKHFFFTDNYENIETGNGIHTVEDITYRIKSDKILFYSGDTSYSEDVITSGHDSDIFIHEATFPSRLSSEAPKFGHSSVKDAINAFKKSESRIFMPTHLSEFSYRELIKNNNVNMIIPEENSLYRI